MYGEKAELVAFITKVERRGRFEWNLILGLTGTRRRPEQVGLCRGSQRSEEGMAFDLSRRSFNEGGMFSEK